MTMLCLLLKMNSRRRPVRSSSEMVCSENTPKKYAQTHQKHNEQTHTVCFTLEVSTPRDATVQVKSGHWDLWTHILITNPSPEVVRVCAFMFKGAFVV